MLDMRFVRENVDLVRQSLKARNAKADLDGLLELDKNRREIIQKVEDKYNIFFNKIRHALVHTNLGQSIDI